jgi:tryptophan synthase alpha chain
MNGRERIAQVFDRLSRSGQKAFIPYVCAGDPSLAVTRRLVPALSAAGSDIIELGVPFSDPVADGPVIQRAAQRALAAGATLRKILTLAADVRAQSAPLVLMTYCNPVYRYGIAAFCRDAAAAGVAGVIIPDLPPEEAGLIAAAADRHGLATIFLAAPTSTGARLRLVALAASGFVYCVSVAGVTGARRSVSVEVAGLVRKIKAVTKLPVGVGFGISTAAHVREICRTADAAIVGSAIVAVIEQAVKARRDPAAALINYVRPLIKAAHH